MNSVRPFQTKLMMGVDQISQFRPNFTISAKFYNPGIPGILGIPGVRAVFLGQYLRCFITFVKGCHSWRGWLFRRAGSDTRDSQVIYANLINCTFAAKLFILGLPQLSQRQMWKCGKLTGGDAFAWKTLKIQLFIRESYRKILMGSTIRKRTTYESHLAKVKILGRRLFPPVLFSITCPFP